MSRARDFIHLNEARRRKNGELPTECQTRFHGDRAVRVGVGLWEQRAGNGRVCGGWCWVGWNGCGSGRRVGGLGGRDQRGSSWLDEWRRDGKWRQWRRERE